MNQNSNIPRGYGPEVRTSAKALLHLLKEAAVDLRVSAAQQVKPMSAALNLIACTVTDMANSEASVSGLGSRYFVRGAMDCTNIDVLVRRVLAGEGDMDLLLLDRSSRSRVAASAIRGYVASHGGEA